jgi:hypothetical protein
MSLNVPADVGFLCDKFALLGEAIEEWSFIWLRYIYVYIYIFIYLRTLIYATISVVFIHLFIFVRCIYLRILVLCSKNNFIYLLFINIVRCIYLRMCDLCNNVSFIYLFIMPGLFIYVYVNYVMMTVSCIYLLFICNARLIYLFTYTWFINNNASFICLYVPGLFIYLFTCVFCHDVSTSDDIPTNARIITEYRIGLNVAIRETFALPDLKVRTEMFNWIPAILNLNFHGVHKYRHANHKMLTKITA